MCVGDLLFTRKRGTFLGNAPFTNDDDGQIRVGFLMPERSVWQNPFSFPFSCWSSVDLSFCGVRKAFGVLFLLVTTLDASAIVGYHFGYQATICLLNQ